MDKYSAWISNIEPLTFGNEKSITQIMSELIPILLMLKKSQDEQNTLLNENFKSLNESSTNFKESISTNTEMFDTLRDTITLNIKNIEDNYISKINDEFNKMLNKLSNIEITQDEFDVGIYSVNYDLNNANSAYSRWNKDTLNKPFIVLKGWNEKVSGYWYNSNDKQVYYNDNITQENEICYIYKYQDKLLFRDVELELGEELFPHTENGYFIGFIDNNTACYFATTKSETETKYSIKIINLTTKEITTYENLELPDNFKSPYLQSNSHYLIKKYNEYYYMIYITNESDLPSIVKSNDLIHWGNVGTMSATGECTFKLINNKFYFVSINTGSWIWDDENMSFTKVSPNNNNFIVLGAFLNKFYGVDIKTHDIYRSDNFDFSNSTQFGSIYQPKDLTFYLDENDNGIICGMPYTYVGGSYPRISQEYLPYHGATINRSTLYFDLLQVFRYKYDGYYDNFRTIPLHKYQYGDFVITDDFKIYSDFNLQLVTLKTEVRGINT